MKGLLVRKNWLIANKVGCDFCPFQHTLFFDLYTIAYGLLIVQINGVAYHLSHCWTTRPFLPSPLPQIDNVFSPELLPLLGPNISRMEQDLSHAGQVRAQEWFNLLLRAFFIVVDEGVYQCVSFSASYCKNQCSIICDAVCEQAPFFCELFHDVRASVGPLGPKWECPIYVHSFVMLISSSNITFLNFSLSSCNYRSPSHSIIIQHFRIFRWDF